MWAIRVGGAFDGERSVRGGAVVLVEGERIAGVEPGGAPVPEGCAVAEFPDATVLPGLIDTHVHLGGDGRDGALERLARYTGDELAEVIEVALRRHLAAGVTTVRDLGDRHWSVLERRDRARRNGAGPVSPTILAAGPPITSVRGHCWFMGGEARGDAELRAAITERAERRVDVVKIMLSGGVSTAGTDVLGCQFSLEETRLLVEQAHAARLPVTVHAHGLRAVEQAIEAGVDGIEHCTCLTPSGIEMTNELLESLAQRDIAICPTIATAPGAVSSPVELAFLRRLGLSREGMARLGHRMYQAGLRIVTGTDGGIAATRPHGMVHAVISLLVTSGIPAAEALAWATSRAAQACGLGTRKGRLRAGYDADLLLVTGDPFSDTSALQHVAAVIAGGHWAIGRSPTAPAVNV